MSALAEWDSFYVIAGSAAGALIGLQFVVITLIEPSICAAEAGAAFGTPTIVSFRDRLALIGNAARAMANNSLDL